MSKLTKNQKLVAGKIEAGKAYTLKEAASLVKEITTTKFDASVDIDVRLGVDPRKANQMVRGVVSLPNGTGKQVRVLCLCTPFTLKLKRPFEKPFAFDSGRLANKSRIASKTPTYVAGLLRGVRPIGLWSILITLSMASAPSIDWYAPTESFERIILFESAG